MTQPPFLSEMVDKSTLSSWSSGLVLDGCLVLGPLGILFAGTVAGFKPGFNTDLTRFVEYSRFCVLHPLVSVPRWANKLLCWCCDLYKIHPTCPGVQQCCWLLVFKWQFLGQVPEVARVGRVGSYLCWRWTASDKTKIDFLSRGCWTPSLHHSVRRSIFCCAIQIRREGKHQVSLH